MVGVGLASLFLHAGACLALIDKASLALRVDTPSIRCERCVLISHVPALLIPRRALLGAAAAAVSAAPRSAFARSEVLEAELHRAQEEVASFRRLVDEGKWDSVRKTIGTIVRVALKYLLHSTACVLPGCAMLSAEGC